MTSNKMEAPRHLASSLNKNIAHNFIRRLGKKLECIVRREILAQIALVSFLTTVVVFLSFPASTADFKAGDLAPYTIRADRGFKIIDTVRTEAAKKEAASRVSPVFLLDDITPELLQNEVETLFSKGRSALTYKIDHEIGSSKWNLISLDDLEDNFYKIFNLDGSSGAWNELVDSHFSTDLERELQNTITDLMGQGLTDKLSDDSPMWHKPVTVLTLSKKNEFSLPSAMMLMSMENAKRHIQVRSRILRSRLDPTELKLFVELSENILKPNLSYDEQETQRRIGAAEQQVSDIYIEVRAGEIIAREGSIISPEDEAKIKALRFRVEKHNDIYKFIGLFIIVFVFLMLRKFFFEPLLEKDFAAYLCGNRCSPPHYYWSPL